MCSKMFGKHCQKRTECWLSGFSANPTLFTPIQRSIQLFESHLICRLQFFFFFRVWKRLRILSFGSSEYLHTCRLVLNYLDSTSYWSPWSSYSPCSATCGSGYKSRTRQCFSHTSSYPQCVGLDKDLLPCYLDPCDGTEYTCLCLYGSQPVLCPLQCHLSVCLSFYVFENVFSSLCYVCHSMCSKMYFHLSVTSVILCVRKCCIFISLCVCHSMCSKMYFHLSVMSVILCVRK